MKLAKWITVTFLAMAVPTAARAAEEGDRTGVEAAQMTQAYFGTNTLARDPAESKRAVRHLRHRRSRVVGETSAPKVAWSVQRKITERLTKAAKRPFLPVAFVASTDAPSDGKVNLSPRQRQRLELERQKKLDPTKAPLLARR